MSWVPAERVIQTVQAQRQVIQSEQARIQQFQVYHSAERLKLDAEARQAYADLGAAALPKLDAPSIAKVAEHVGLPGLVQEDLPGRLEARRAWLKTRIQAITHDPRFAQRELLRHPNTGSLVRALAEAREHRRPFREIVKSCEEHPRWERLWQVGFGRPEHGTPWWRYSYWQDRSAADEILKRFPDKTFEAVRDEYSKAVDNVTVYDGEITKLKGEIAAGEALAREHAALCEELKTLDTRGLEHTRGRIVQHLMAIDASMVAQRFRATNSPLHMLFLRASGVTSKLRYLDEIQKKSIGEMASDLGAQWAKLAAVEQRTRRRWAPMPMDKFQKLAEDRRPKYEKRWGRFQKTYTCVHDYDRWDRGRYYEQLLWWDLMTRGRHDGRYIHEVHTFHVMHPGYHYDPDWKARKAAWEDDIDGDVDDGRDDATDAGFIAGATAAVIEADRDEPEDMSTDPS